MNAKLKVQPPVEKPWIGLIEALTWIAFHRSFDLDVLLSARRPEPGALKDIHPRLQAAWEELADRASEEGIAIRGKRRRERHRIAEKKERRLTPDDLRNCRYLSWPKDVDGIRKVRVEWFWDDSVTDEVCTTRPQTRSNVERLHDFFGSDTLATGSEGDSEALARAFQHVGFDYVDVVVSRRGLMRAWPIRGKGRMASLASENKAAQWLDKVLTARAAATNLKADVIFEMQAEFPLTPTQAIRVWKRVAPNHKEWHHKRGRTKGVRKETKREI